MEINEIKIGIIKLTSLAVLIGYQTILVLMRANIASCFLL